MNFTQKTLTTLLSLLFSVNAFSQKKEIYYGQKATLKAEVILESGETKNGFIENFAIPRIGSNLQSVTSIEKRLNFTSKEINFKTTATSVKEALKIEDIKRIIILDADDSERLIYDKMKLKTINTQLEVVDLDKTVLLPLQQEGKLSLYGFSVTMMSTNNLQGFGTAKHYDLTLFIPYIKNKNSDYAYIPFDINRMNFLNIGTLEGKFKIAVEEATKDCPEFSQFMKENYEKMDKIDKKELKKQYFEKEDKKKEIRKTVKNKDMQNFLQAKVDSEYGMKPYIQIVDQYNSTCTK
ncbi:hypothetical protein [Chryseobacterium sp.]|uniref:hypothetical protein n=1 Tax=Chryseobacterium sp. TaxID=1871047 RepID=UPI00388E173F